jgi:hypothetical protein
VSRACCVRRAESGLGLSRQFEGRSRAQRLIRWQIAALVVGAVWAVGLEQGRGQPLAADANGCAVTRQGRVYVAVADGVELEDYERAAGAAQAIMHLVKASLCAPAPKARRPWLTASLRSALEARRQVVLDEVRFDDEALEHARVRLRSTAPDRSGAAVERAWRVHVHRDAAWQIDTVRDESVDR